MNVIIIVSMAMPRGQRRQLLVESYRRIGRSVTLSTDTIFFFFIITIIIILIVIFINGPTGHFFKADNWALLTVDGDER